jgi:hypothetical protein
MRNFEDVNKQYLDVLKAINNKQKELNSLEVEKNRLSGILYESRLAKDILNKEDINKIFSKFSTMVWSTPYYNECTKENNSIQVTVSMGYKYFKLDENNKIINTYNADDDTSKSLIGKYIDLNSYEADEIRGNHKLKVGIIKDGKFKLEL